MRYRFLRRGLLTVLLVMALSFVPVTAFGLTDENRDQTTNEESDKPATATERAKTRLQGAKLRTCQNRTKNIEAIMTRSVLRVEKHIQLFSNVTERVQSFYEKKGKMLATYDELMAAVDAAKAKTQVSLEDLKNSQDFTCDSDDPKGDVSTFKAAHRLLLQDLKEYRTAVKNLIVGVKSVQRNEQ